MEHIKDFEYHNIKFHLNDNYSNSEFESRYNLVYWNVHFEKWISIGTCNGIEDAIGLIDNYMGG